jgi:hypothetical protein
MPSPAVHKDKPRSWRTEDGSSRLQRCAKSSSRRLVNDKGIESTGSTRAHSLQSRELYWIDGAPGWNEMGELWVGGRENKRKATTEDLKTNLGVRVSSTSISTTHTTPSVQEGASERRERTCSTRLVAKITDGFARRNHCPPAGHKNRLQLQIINSL